MMREKITRPAREGLTKSIKILWLLAKIIIPISILIKVAEHYHLVESLSVKLSPVMSWSGLPGEATIPLSLGFLVNIYAAAGAIANLSWSPREVTIMGLMLGICHELPVESIICSYTGLKIPVSIILRLGAALFAGIFLNFLYLFFGG